MNDILNMIYAYAHGIWRYRWSGVAVAWIVAVCGWLVVYGLPDQYQSKATVYIDTESIMKPLLEGLTVETGATSDPRVIKQVLLSRATLLSVLRETDMDLQGVTPEKMDDLLADLADSITLTENQVSGRGGGRSEKSRIYEISFQSDSAEKGYQVVSKLLDTLIENTLSSSRIDTKIAQKFIDKQIREYESRLNLAEQKLAEFKKKHVGLMPGERGGYYQRLQSELDGIAATKSQLRLARQRYAELNKQLSGESPVLDSGAQASKLRSYQEKLVDLQTRFTDKHPDVIALKAKIADLKSNAKSAPTDDMGKFNPVYQNLKVLASKAKVEVGSLQIKLEEQQRSVANLRKQVNLMPQVEAELAKLNRDYTVTKKRYLDLINRREAARLTEEAGENRSDVTFRVINPPLIPSKPWGPNRPLLLSAVLLLSLFAGIAWAVVRYFLHPTFADFRQLREKTGLPVLGIVNLNRANVNVHAQKAQMAMFLVAMAVLLGIFVGVVWYQHPGSMLVRSLIGVNAA